MALHEEIPWLPNFISTSPLFEPLTVVGAPLYSFSNWPSLTQLQDILNTSISPAKSHFGAPIRIVAQGSKAKTFSDKYESRLYLKGELQVRSATWHDLFNILVWATFPCTKAALNQRHFHAAQAREKIPSQRLRRSRIEDALTIFDEGGLIITSCQLELCELITDFKWKELFWHRRQDVQKNMKCFVFGHALYEKALEPYMGISGKAIILEVEKQFMGLSLTEQLSYIDTKSAAYLNDGGAFQTPADFAAFPLLGMPGWCVENEHEEYYHNINYFRPK